MVELRSSSKPDQTSFYLDLQPRSCKCNLQRNLPFPLRTLRGLTKRGEKGGKKHTRKKAPACLHRPRLPKFELSSPSDPGTEAWRSVLGR